MNEEMAREIIDTIIKLFVAKGLNMHEGVSILASVVYSGVMALDEPERTDASNITANMLEQFVLTLRGGPQPEDSRFLPPITDMH